MPVLHGSMLISAPHKALMLDCYCTDPACCTGAAPCIFLPAYHFYKDSACTTYIGRPLLPQQPPPLKLQAISHTKLVQLLCSVCWAAPPFSAAAFALNSCQAATPHTQKSERMATIPVYTFSAGFCGCNVAWMQPNQKPGTSLLVTSTGILQVYSSIPAAHLTTSHASHSLLLHHYLLSCNYVRQVSF